MTIAKYIGNNVWGWNNPWFEHRDGNHHFSNRTHLDLQPLRGFFRQLIIQQPWSVATWPKFVNVPGLFHQVPDTQGRWDGLVEGMQGWSCSQRGSIALLMKQHQPIVLLFRPCFWTCCGIVNKILWCMITSLTWDWFDLLISSNQWNIHGYDIVTSLIDLMQRPKTHIFLVGPWPFNLLFSAVICKFWGSQSLYQQHLKCWGARDLIEFLHLPDLKPSLLARLGPSVFVGWLNDCHGNTKQKFMKQLQKIPRCHGVFVEDLHQVMDCNWPKWEKELVESYHS